MILRLMALTLFLIGLLAGCGKRRSASAICSSVNLLVLMTVLQRPLRGRGADRSLAQNESLRGLRSGEERPVRDCVSLDFSPIEKTSWTRVAPRGLASTPLRFGTSHARPPGSIH
jgi:hypothetical protein